ncbi:carbon storage regulator CsrA [Cryobacterium sp. TMS1-20-1]|uniref:carbon storage regulator CsrA n=1 Tax=Cryobacterium sp. TMS1-20-1 TaxID=1259223 RepID=UPI00106B3EE9|nr:carbon storage regulator CsrA [Cryobacterium sp. TMS1-20-1]TFC75571.1 carbon storage regulator CsrA [Cryobacterium sp. TMS1-20-1]
MLVLTRKIGEKILIGDDIVISVLDVRGDSIRIGVDAPRGLKIQRDEVVRAVLEANVAASQVDPAAEDRIKNSLKSLAALQSVRIQASPAVPLEAAETPAPHPPRVH